MGLVLSTQQVVEVSWAEKGLGGEGRKLSSGEGMQCRGLWAFTQLNSLCPLPDSIYYLLNNYLIWKVFLNVQTPPPKARVLQWVVSWRVPGSGRTGAFLLWLCLHTRLGPPPGSAEAQPSGASPLWAPRYSG